MKRFPPAQWNTLLCLPLRRNVHRVFYLIRRLPPFKTKSLESLLKHLSIDLQKSMLVSTSTELQWLFCETTFAIWIIHRFQWPLDMKCRHFELASVIGVNWVTYDFYYAISRAGKSAGVHCIEISLAVRILWGEWIIEMHALQFYLANNTWVLKLKYSACQMLFGSNKRPDS